MDEQTYQSCGSVIKSFTMEERKSTNGTNLCGKRRRENYFELCRFLNVCNAIESFPELKENIGIEDITPPISSSSRAIEWRNEHILELESYSYQIYTSM